MEPKPVRDDPAAQATLRETADRRIPDELVRRLHEANGRADGLRRQLEGTMSDADYGHAARVQSVGEELRQAEREIEEVTRQIGQATPPEAKGGTG